MNAADKDPEECDAAGFADPPLTVELLADLQAGLLDDATAARVRSQVRSDPQAQQILRALNQARRDVASVGADPASAPNAPPAVTARILAALRSARPSTSPGAAHAARPPVHPTRVIAGVAGLCAVVAAIGLGTAALLDRPPPTPSAPATAQHITVSAPAAVIPLSQPQILELLRTSPDYGPLGGPLHDPSRRASCLSGLGYPASTPVLGAQPIDINATPAVLLVVPADTPDKLAVFAVTSHCSAADTGLLASTMVPRA
ncbi:hypothetical protein [Mycobacterium decipiens]|uniref:Anti-sigma-M factor RsmA n=1 Tax=Mycobacterium decipiens TaxID=1430326 RepID=A0A1X2LRL8_9MYCO|nr:hypothetical protein [Mycobacterium decipiens]OSC39291.1 hypothetical protein B8W66_17595 [Mycobacterium decipiens]